MSRAALPRNFMLQTIYMNRQTQNIENRKQNKQNKKTNKKGTIKT